MATATERGQILSQSLLRASDKRRRPNRPWRRRRRHPLMTTAQTATRHRSLTCASGRSRRQCMQLMRRPFEWEPDPRRWWRPWRHRRLRHRMDRQLKRLGKNATQRPQRWR